ncbi:MAG: hypothetical protein ACUVXF_07420 [Desulfobaccales bacterium]
MDMWIGILAVLVGLVSCFYGYPLFRLLLILAGLFVGYFFGHSLGSPGQAWQSLVLGLVGAGLMALLAYPLWSVGVSISGALVGFAIFGEIGILLEASRGLTILLAVLGGVVIGVLFYQMRDFFVMVVTAFKGAAEVFVGLGWLLPFQIFRRGGLMAGAIIILGAIGLAVQYGMFKNRRTYSRPSPD